MIDWKRLKHRNDIPLFLNENDLLHRICEVGVKRGINFHNILSCEPQLAVAVDIWDLWESDGTFERNDAWWPVEKLREVYEGFVESVKDKPNVRVVKNYSHLACELFEDGYFDFIYIDADHSYNGAKQDINCWWPKVRQGGVMAGHDYCERHLDKTKRGQRFQMDYGVKRAVDELISSMPAAAFHQTSEPGANKEYPSWFVYKI